MVGGTSNGCMARKNVSIIFRLAKMCSLENVYAMAVNVLCKKLETTLAWPGKVWAISVFELNFSGFVNNFSFKTICATGGNF